MRCKRCPNDGHEQKIRACRPFTGAVHSLQLACRLLLPCIRHGSFAGGSPGRAFSTGIVSSFAVQKWCAAKISPVAYAGGFCTGISPETIFQAKKRRLRDQKRPPAHFMYLLLDYGTFPFISYRKNTTKVLFAFAPEHGDIVWESRAFPNRSGRIRPLVKEREHGK